MEFRFILVSFMLLKLCACASIPVEIQEDEDPQARLLGLYGGLGGYGYGGIGGGYGYGLGYGGLGYGGLGYGGLGGRYYDEDGNIRREEGSTWNSEGKVIRIPGTAIEKVIIKMKKPRAQHEMTGEPAEESNTNVQMAHPKETQRLEVSNGSMGNTDESNMENNESAPETWSEQMAPQTVVKTVPHVTFEHVRKHQLDN